MTELTTSERIILDNLSDLELHGIVETRQGIRYNHVWLHPDARQAVIALVARFEAMQTSAAARRVYAQRAVAILDDKPSMTRLFAKAKQFSAHASREPMAAIHERVLTAVQKLGQASVRETREALAEAGHERSIKSVGRYLDGLCREGRVRAHGPHHDRYFVASG